MSEEIETADANLRAIARLRTDLQLAQRDLLEARAALQAERAAQLAAAADAAVLREALIEWIDADGTIGFADADESLADLARSLRTGARPGAALLAERTQARALADATRQYQRAIAELNGIGAAEQALWVALAAYDVALETKD